MLASAIVRLVTALRIAPMRDDLLSAARHAPSTRTEACVPGIRELAANYRDQGKRYFLQIEECSLMTSEVRTVCEALKKKIAASTIAA